MDSVAADLYVLAGLLAFLAYLILSTFRFNHTRKVRMRWRKITARLLNYK